MGDPWTCISQSSLAETETSYVNGEVNRKISCNIDECSMMTIILQHRNGREETTPDTLGSNEDKV